MRYMMLIRETEEEMALRGDTSERGKAYWGAWQAYSQSITDRIANGAALMPPESATSVRVQGDERIVQDGPFADVKEQLGGYMMLEVADLDEALEIAARCPAAANGSVELRPVLEM